MIRKILIGYDDSEPSRKALDMALDMASKYGSTLDVIAVVSPPEYLGDKESQKVLQNSRQAQRSLLQGLKPRVEAAGVTTQFEIAVGKPGDQLLQHAERENADLIIVGHSGKTFFEALRMGSVSKQVMHDARCPVLVVR